VRRRATVGRRMQYGAHSADACSYRKPSVPSSRDFVHTNGRGFCGTQSLI